MPARGVVPADLDREAGQSRRTAAHVVDRGDDGAVTGLTFTPDNLGMWIIAWKDAAQTSNANYQIVLPGGITAKKL